LPAIATRRLIFSAGQNVNALIPYFVFFESIYVICVWLAISGRPVKQIYKQTVGQTETIRLNCTKIKDVVEPDCRFK
jgi:hypothetical protein